MPVALHQRYANGGLQSETAPENTRQETVPCTLIGKDINGLVFEV